ncbi:MAG: type I DNA topoisomerase [Chloroflexi bacterium]|nr:type I DNA topoisomerase [Chloroflexota bacterium]MDA1271152.1 type I DNA topoisomerase [Chloroflexota bacterium]PKB58698.1 MAG: DNA topoisomerase I [SAR202 cluster bacterium Casp-Chloro-G2]
MTTNKAGKAGAAKKATTKSAAAKTTAAKTTAKKTAAKGKAAKAKTTRSKSSAVKLPSSAGKSLVIVESPAKARTVGQILGRKYVVTASQGHVRDLPKSKIGVDVEQNFEPSYVIMKDKRSLLTQIKKAGNDADEIFLATDPDREGEAISWHLQSAAEWKDLAKPPKRVVFHEITKEAVEEAFKNPREIDMQLVNAQQARRILDRLVGYQISPLLWRRVQRGTSAGRVQSVCLRMVVDREREIEAFVPVESWTIDNILRKAGEDAIEKNQFSAALHSVKGERARINIPNEEDARRYESELKEAEYKVAEVRKRDVRQRPSPPFITSTMQQEAGRKLRYTAQRTMAVAQQLYEGLNVGAGGQVGLITYMRTDSTQVADTALAEVREYIQERYGKDHLPAKARNYTRSAKGAQEAHEAVRPTSIKRDPASLKDYLSSDQLNLYTLIWSRMLASQMEDARSEATTLNIDAVGKGSENAPGVTYNFRASGSVLRFAGFRTVYLEGRDDSNEPDDKNALPPLSEGDVLDCSKLEANQHFTEPPPRYTEATLIKTMEEKGIGRPSTYAPTIGTLVDRMYVERERNRLTPTKLGITVTDLLTEYFETVMDPDFTARMEEELDDVSRGERDWVPMLGEFYEPFQAALANADELMPKIRMEEETDEVCDCSGSEKCEHTDLCGKPLVIKTGRFGRFMACTGFPDCRNTKPVLKRTGVTCPKPNCGGDIVERKARGRGRSFFGCSNYPECDLLLNQAPLLTPCPECGGLMVQKNRNNAACTSCSWEEAILDNPPGGESDGVDPGNAEELATVGD